MIIPWNTDAPIYHFPWATLALMGATTAAYVAEVNLDGEQVIPLILSHGKGLHPVQWISSNFIHADLFHLIGNLIFLWAFALVVEGKVGFLPFLALYLGIGAAECGFEQVLFLGAKESHGSFGASAIVYGMMAMALVWAPRNDLSCIGWFRFRIYTFDMPILWFAVLYIAYEFILAAVQGFNVSSSLLHVFGAGVGFAVATLMLRLHWVDCEKWDLYSVWGGHVGRDSPKVEQAKRLKAGNPDERADAKADAAADLMRRAIDEGNAVAALSFHDKALRARRDWRPADAEWLALIQLLASAKDWEGSVRVMEDYLARSLKPSPRVRLRLAQVLIREQKRPAHALSVLDAIPRGALPADLDATVAKLRATAEQMRDDGVLELDGKAW